ncbi:MAG: hypothetical protein IKO05_04810 [Selenomonadaceae bacterium]|nr:hypothetical protein [Selenomonadaceae bacterium]
MADVNETLRVTDETSSPVTINSDTGVVDATARTTDILIYGNDLNNSIGSGSGNDTIRGSAGDDQILGNAGNDDLYGEAGNDSLWGGAGLDTLHGGNGNDLLRGGANEDYLRGGAGNDSLLGEAGNDSLDGGEGDDTLYGGKGNDTLIGGAGNDTLYGEAGADVFVYTAGEGNDLIADFTKDDTLQISDGVYSTAVSGSDVLIAVDEGVITLAGAASLSALNIISDSDTLTVTDETSSPVTIASNVKVVDASARTTAFEFYGNDLDNIFYGGAGNDSVRGVDGRDELHGGAGDDTLLGGNDDDTVWGGKGNDDLYGSAGDDSVYGEEGDDSISGGLGNDTLSGGAGADVFTFKRENFGNDLVTDFSADDTIVLATTEYSTAVSGDDVIITVSDGEITLQGAASLSALNIISENDTLTVTDETSSPVTIGSEIKVVDASARTTPLELYGNDLGNSIKGGTSSDTLSGAAGDDELRGGKGNDKIFGEAGNDSLLGEAGNDSLDGGEGDDTLYGGKGNDTLIGGAGNDTLFGEAGSDVFVYADGAGNDLITDFTKDDTLNISVGKYSTAVSGADVLVTVGEGVITLAGAASLSTLNIISGEMPTWKLDGTTATYGDLIVTGVKSLDGLKLSGKILTVSKSSLGTDDVKISDGYTLALADDVSTPTTTKKWSLSKTTASYKQTTAAGYTLADNSITYSAKATKTLVTVKGVTSLDGLKLSKKVVTVSAASLGTSNVTISDGYTLALGSDAAKPSTTGKWSLSKTTASYKQTTAAGYTLADNSITYSKKATETLVKVKGVTSLDGLALKKKVVTVSAASLGTSNVTISDGYTLKLGSDVTKTSTKKAWSLSKTTATYKQTTVAGYSLTDNAITYTKKAAEKLATVKGVNDKSGLKVSGKTIKLAGDSLASKVTVSGEYTFDFDSDFKNATIIGSSDDDTITVRGKKVSVKGGAGDDTIKIFGTGTIAGGKGDDVFVFKSGGANVITDYEEADKISLASGTANVSVRGKDVVFTVGSEKISLTGAAGKDITYIEGGAEKIYESAMSGIEMNAKETSAKLTVNYTEDKFDAADYVSSLVTINAAEVPHSLTILGNNNKNKITGTSEDDYIDGKAGGDTILSGAGDDTLIGGAGADTLSGGAHNDSLSGGAGNDSLNGGSGDDTLWGGAGSDTLFGGDGEDLFIYNDGEGKDIISDYTSVDKVIVSGKIESPSVDSDGNVTFQIGSGQLIFPNSSNKYIYLLDDKGNQLMTYKPTVK